MRKQPLLGEALLCLLLGIPIALIGQQSTVHYDLKHYKLPYLKRQVLELQFDFSSMNNFNTTRQNEEDPEKSSDNSINSTFNPYYSFYLNTPKLQMEQRVYGDFLDYSSSSSSSDILESASRNFSPEITYLSENRFYFKNKLFAEVDVSFQYWFNNSLDSEEQRDEMDIVYSRSEITRKSNSLNASVPIMVGWGRIERVEDARLAVYILDDLNKADRLAKELSEEEITEFAQFISYLQNERFFDNREKKIWEIQQIDSFMVARQFITKADAVYFTLVNDNWDYARGPSRSKGFRISAGITPGISNQGMIDEDEEYLPASDTTLNSSYEIDFQTRGIGTGMRLDYEVPINLYWQFSLANDFSAERGNHSIKTIYNASDTTRNQTNIDFTNSFSIGISYYPNSRTSFGLFASNSITNGHTIYESITIERNDFRIGTSVSLDMNYYISPRMRLYASGGVSKTNQQNKMIDTIEDRSKYDNLDLRFSASLIYQIF